MLKKSLCAGGGLLLLLALLFGTDVFSYMSTSMGRVHQSVKDSVPVGFEIERARRMIDDLHPEISRNMHLIAKEEVEVAKLEKEIRRHEEQLDKDRGAILRLKNDLDTGSESFVYHGRPYTAKQVKADLTHRFDNFKTSEATVNKLSKILQARHNGVSAAQQKLEAMLAAKRELEVDVENLEARLKMVEVAQTTSDFNFDDSHLARTKELISDIGTRIDVAEKLVNANTQYFDRIPVDEPEVEGDISNEIADYFGEGRPEVEALVEAESRD